MKTLRLIFFFALLSIVTVPAFAHEVVTEFEQLPLAASCIYFLKLGFTHILPAGLDHILFVFSLFLLNPKPSVVIKQSAAFTVAHTVTLGLAMYGVIKIPSVIIEPLISLSIAFVAAENLFTSKLKPSRISLVFLFGLVHGLGFASSLAETGLPENNYLLSLVMFNAGVELGQLTVILIAYLLIGKLFSGKSWYRRRMLIPLSCMIIVIAMVWTVDRVFF